MKVVVDTSVWSQSLRRSAVRDSPHTELLVELIRDGRVVLIGAVRQELLSGIRESKQFDTLRERLRAFPDGVLELDDHETAAVFFNTCMRGGVQGSMIDFLICAFAARRRYPILTLDGDFHRYAALLPISLLRP